MKMGLKSLNQWPAPCRQRYRLCSPSLRPSSYGSSGAQGHSRRNILGLGSEFSRKEKRNNSPNFWMALQNLKPQIRWALIMISWEKETSIQVGDNDGGDGNNGGPQEPFAVRVRGLPWSATTEELANKMRKSVRNVLRKIISKRWLQEMWSWITG